ncbi:MAG: YaaR family protein [Firmicutes bacterium]|nr:YaaR family protein [Bacillota bacterium]
MEKAFSELLRLEQVGELDLPAAIEEIDEYARRFKKSPILEHLLAYKRKVRVILLYLVNRSYDVQENSFYDPTGRRRLLVLVDRIDHKLEELTREFLDKHSDPLDLVSRLDEIRGLLLDLQI